VGFVAAANAGVILAGGYDAGGGGTPMLFYEAPGRVYAATSPFNQPIPSSPAIAANSEPLVSGLAEVGRAGGFVIAVRRYTVPVYLASADTPRYRVALTAAWAPRHTLTGVPIPAGAAPDPSSDGHMAIVDRSTGCEFDFWRMRNRRGAWSAAWGNSLRITGSGVFPRGLSARASGFGLLGGLILPRDLARGYIAHALIFSYPFTSGEGFVRPATEGDGTSTLPEAMPEGARLQLDPSFDTSRLPRAERIIARALQRYGMYLADTGRKNVSLYAANPQSYPQDPYAGILPASNYPNLKDIPLSRFRVLAHGPILQRPTRVVPSGCGSFR
jgi:hypothetical protein